MWRRSPRLRLLDGRRGLASDASRRSMIWLALASATFTQLALDFVGFGAAHGAKGILAQRVMLLTAFDQTATL